MTIQDEIKNVRTFYDYLSPDGWEDHDYRAVVLLGGEISPGRVRSRAGRPELCKRLMDIEKQRGFAVTLLSWFDYAGKRSQYS